MRRSGRTSGRTRSTPRSSSSRVVTAASVADDPPARKEGPCASERSVPPCSFPCSWSSSSSEGWSSPRPSRSSRSSPRWRPSACCARPGTRASRLSGPCSPSPRRRRLPERPEGSGLLPRRDGIVLAAVASFTRVDPHDGLQGVDGDRVRRAVRGDAVVPRQARPRRHPFDTALPPSGRTGMVLLLVLAVVVRHGRLPVGKSIRRTHFDPHLTSQDHRGLMGVVATTVVVGPCGVRQNPLHADARPADARAAQSRPRRIGHQTRSRGEGSGTLIPGKGMLGRVDRSCSPPRS